MFEEGDPKERSQFEMTSGDDRVDLSNLPVFDLDEVQLQPRIEPVERCSECGRHSVAGPIVCKGIKRPKNKGRLYKFVSRRDSVFSIDRDGVLTNRKHMYHPVSI